MTEDGRLMTDTYKFQKLRFYQLGLDYLDAIFDLSENFPSQKGIIL